MRLDRGNAGACAQLHLGPFGTGDHARPVHDALGSERDAGERASLLHARRDEKRYLPLRGSARTPRPVRIPAVWGADHVGRQHGAREQIPLLVRIHGRRARPHLLQLPASQSARRQVDQQGSHHGTRRLEFVRLC